MIKRYTCGLAAGVLILGACGSSSSSDDDDSSTSDDAPTEAADPTESDAADDSDTNIEAAADDVLDDANAEDVQENAQEIADDIVDDLEAVQESEGGGGATLTANGQTWEFSSVLCAFGEDQIGQPGAVFNLSAIADGLQLYVSIDDSGNSHSLSINDIEDFENPSVALSADPFTGGPANFLTLDDKSVSGEVVLIDESTGEATGEPAQLSATCP
jgi:hypothetical protein